MLATSVTAFMSGLIVGGVLMFSGAHPWLPLPAAVATVLVVFWLLVQE